MQRLVQLHSEEPETHAPHVSVQVPPVQVARQSQHVPTPISAGHPQLSNAYEVTGAAAAAPTNSRITAKRFTTLIISNSFDRIGEPAPPRFKELTPPSLATVKLVGWARRTHG